MKNINYNKIKDNINNLKVNHNLMIVLKDDAYNFDLKNVCVISLACGIKHFAVKDIKEAIEVRMLTLDADILILGQLPNEVHLLKDKNITVTVTNKEELDICLKYGIDYHVEVRTSMNRFGIEYNELNEYITSNMKGIYIHTPVTCDIENKRLLNELKKHIIINNLEDVLIHVGGSSFLKIEHSYFNRIGCAIFEDALNVTAKVLQVKKVLLGECLGYEHSYRLTKDSYVAVCNVGYVNGLSRENKHSFCYINSKKYFFEGYKCMDYSFIVVDETIRMGDIVELLGDNISEDIFCDMNGMIKHQMYLNIK